MDIIFYNKQSVFERQGIMEGYFKILKQKFEKIRLLLKQKSIAAYARMKQSRPERLSAAAKALWRAAASGGRKIYARCYNFFNAAGARLGKIGIKANWVSWIGFGIGIFAVNFLAMEMYGWALAAILLNRFCDGIDGAIARSTKVTNFGVFLDATLDYIFYGGVIWGFALADGGNASAACFLMFGFTAAACAMLAYSVVAYKINSKQELNLDNSPFYLGGIAQGSETFVVLVVLCLVPGWFVQLAAVLGVLSLIKAFSVIVAAYYNFVIMVKK